MLAAFVLCACMLPGVAAWQEAPRRPRFATLLALLLGAPLSVLAARPARQRHEQPAWAQRHGPRTPLRSALEEQEEEGEPRKLDVASEPDADGPAPYGSVVQTADVDGAGIFSSLVSGIEAIASKTRDLVSGQEAPAAPAKTMATAAPAGKLSAATAPTIEEPTAATAAATGKPPLESAVLASVPTLAMAPAEELMYEELRSAIKGYNVPPTNGSVLKEAARDASNQAVVLKGEMETTKDGMEALRHVATQMRIGVLDHKGQSVARVRGVIDNAAKRISATSTTEEAPLDAASPNVFSTSTTPSSVTPSLTKPAEDVKKLVAPASLPPGKGEAKNETNKAPTSGTTSAAPSTSKAQAFQAEKSTSSTTSEAKTEAPTVEPTATPSEGEAKTEEPSAKKTSAAPSKSGATADERAAETSKAPQTSEAKTEAPTSGTTSAAPSTDRVKRLAELYDKRASGRASAWKTEAPTTGTTSAAPITGNRVKRMAKFYDKLASGEATAADRAGARALGREMR